MTQVPATTAGGEVMQFASTGLEDFSMSDAVLPRIRIAHKDGMWVDNLTQQPMATLRFIVLGLVKQRVLFHPNVGDDDVPMCKSSDYKFGYPNPEAPREKSFPWDKSGFDTSQIQLDADKQVIGGLPCDGCQLKEWGSHPLGQTPYCSEQWTMPIYYESSGLPEGTDWTPAILTLQKSSIKPIRAYLSSFATSGRPPFMAVVRGTLKTQQRGEVIYSIPSFTKEGESDRNRWLEFSEQFLEMKTFLQRPPVRDDSDDAPAAAPAAPPADNTWGQQAPAPAAPAAPPAAPPVQQAPAEPAPAGDPWATPAPAADAGDPWVAQPTQPVEVVSAPAAPAPAPPAPAPPVQQAPPPQAPPAPPAPPAAPAQQQAPVQPPAPPAPAVPAAQPVAPQEGQAQPAAGNELPF